MYLESLQEKVCMCVHKSVIQSLSAGNISHHGFVISPSCLTFTFCVLIMTHKHSVQSGIDIGKLQTEKRKQEAKQRRKQEKERKKEKDEEKKNVCML